MRNTHFVAFSRHVDDLGTQREGRENVFDVVLVDFLALGTMLLLPMLPLAVSVAILGPPSAGASAPEEERRRCIARRAGVGVVGHWAMYVRKSVGGAVSWRHNFMVVYCPLTFLS